MLPLSNPSTYDLSTEVGLQAYLASTPFAASSVTQISGGSSNFTFRATLTTPYDDNRLGTVPSVVVKHARNYASASRNIPLSTQRMDVDLAALALIPTLPFYTDASPMIHLPYVLASDQANHVSVLEDCGKLPSIKDYVLAEARTNPGACTTITEEIGQLLGEFLAKMHVWGYTLLQGDPSDTSVLDPFRNNDAATEAKKLCAWRTAGRLVDMVKRFSPTDECDWEAFSNKLQAEVIQKEDTFTMGDFWTGNILVETSANGDKLKRLVILDWELAKLGVSAADIGQFAAEAHLLQRYAQHHKPGKALVSSFIKSYEAASGGDPIMHATLFNPNEIAACTAAHAAVWGVLGQWDVDDSVKETSSKFALGICAESSRGAFEGRGVQGLSKIWEE